MRRLLTIIGIVVAVIIVLAVVVPMFIPAGVYRDQVVSAVQSATGRQLHINGAVKLTILPSLAIEANDVSFDNAPGGVAKQMATLTKLEVGVHLLPLLSGKIDIARFVLTDPVIHLEVDKAGRPNWEFGPPEPAKKPGTTVTATAQTDSLNQLQLGVVKLVNGTVDYFDARTNTRYAASDIGVTVKLPSLDEEGAIDGAVTWQGKPIKLSLVASRPRALMGGAADSTLKVSVTSELIDFAFDGKMAGGAKSKLDGMLSVESNSVRSLATFAGSPPPIGGDGLAGFSLKGKVTSVGSAVSFDDIALKLDSLKAGGNLSIDANGAVPVVKGALTVGMLDLNPYLSAPAKAPAAAPAGPAPPAAQGAPAASKDWSDAPIDTTPLKAIDIDLTIAADGLRYQKIEVGKSALAIAIKSGRLTLGLTQLQLYGGSGKGQVTVDGASGVPALTLGFNLSGVQAEPLLAAAIGLDKVTGTGQVNFDLSARGRSQRELVGALSGRGGFGFANGAIKGIDLAAMMKNVQQAFLSAVAGGAQQTAFAELGGTFTASNGVISNNDLVLRSPVVQVKGSGTVSLPNKSVDYRVEPEASVNSKDYSVAVKITGPWDKLSYQPDLQAMITKNAGKLLQGVIGGKASGSSNNAGSLLKGLFGK